MVLPPCLIFNFSITPSFGEGVPSGGRRGSSHRLSIQTTFVSGTVWPQFAMQVLTGGCQPQFGGRGGRIGSEMAP